MKKFLTVLLALSVVFTYSFSAVGSAFAAESYTLDDYANALTAEKAAQLNYLNSAKAQAINGLSFDKDGYADGFMKGAYEAAADKVISDATAKMDEEINKVLNTTDWPKQDAPDLDKVRVVTKEFDVKGTKKDITTATGMTDAMKAETDTLNKAQAPLSKAAVEAKLDVDLSKYNSTDKEYTANGEPNGTELTAAQAVERAISLAKEAIAAADKKATDAEKIAAYKKVATDFDTAMKKIKTLADEEFDDNINAGTVDAAVEQLATILLNDLKTDLDIDPDMTADAIKDWSAITAGDLKAFWEADKTNAKKGEFFGVAIADITKVTRTEVAAVNTASKAAVAAAKAPIKAYADGKVQSIKDLDTKAERYTALANASKAVKVYEDVVAAGEKMKAAYEFGIKVYDDAAVAQAVKAAEKLVYADLMGTFDKAEDYIKEAAKNEGITLEAVNFELQKFNKAVEDAAKKMYKDGTTAKVPQVKVLYGDNKTPEADFVYLKETYYETEAAAWAKIAQKTVADLKDAQSYDEITAIMTKAAEEFDKLLHNDVASDVIAARANYVEALTNYGTLKKGLLDDKDYPNTNIDAAVEQGKKLINKATTVAGVEAAYEEAKAIVDSLKTADELKAAKEAVEKQIAALPYTAKLTVADKAAVKAAYEAYDAYMKMPGASDIASASKTLLKEKYNKVNELVAAEIDAKAKALNEKLAKAYTGSDADVAARVALKAEADAVKAEAKALTDEIGAVNDTYAAFLNVLAMAEVAKLAAHDFMNDLVLDAEIKLVKAAKDGATAEEMKAALEAYNKLTDKQKYTLDASVLQMANLIKTRLIASVEGLKITVSTKLYTKSNKIRVNWKVKGQADAADGYYVYKSTKAQKNYKYMGKTKKSYMDNKKNLKKGKRYFYKVKAYVEIDGQKYFSDYSNKGNRIYK